MSRIDDIVAQIRTAIYGKDVRENIAEGISQIYEASDMAISSISNKISKPSSGDGTNGQVLKSLGNGNTEWSDPDLPSEEKMVEAIDNWLDDHPEATTTVEDNSLSSNKLNEDVKKKAYKGSTISPIYIGDYLCPMRELPSCCVKIGDYFYSANAPGVTRGTNIGSVRKFDITNNIELIEDKVEVPLGHANSMAYDYDNDKIYVAPVWDLSTGEKITVKYLYVYSSSFSYIGTMTIPTIAMGVSYDYVTRSLYYIDYERKIYKFNSTANTWSLYSIISNFSTIKEPYNQDFAVYNNQFFVSDPYGNMVYGELEQTSCKILGSYVVTCNDSLTRFCLGELEGMEFDSLGHLYAVNYINLTTDVRDSYIVELPVGLVPPKKTAIWGTTFGLNDNTLTLSEDTQKTFSLATYQIRSLNQLFCRVLNDNASRVTIPEGNDVVDDYIIDIKRNVDLIINGSLTITRIRLYTGLLSIRSENANNLITFTNTSGVCIDNMRASFLKICGTNSIRVSVPNFTGERVPFISIMQDYPITFIRLLPILIDSGKYLVMGSRKLTNIGLYYGNSNVALYNLEDSFSVPSGFSMPGLVTNSAKSMRFGLFMPKSVPTNFTSITATGALCLRCAKGYANGTQTASTINLANTTDYNISILASNNYLIISISSESGFSNVDNNIPVIAEVTTALNISFT